MRLAHWTLIVLFVVSATGCKTFEAHRLKHNFAELTETGRYEASVAPAERLFAIAQQGPPAARIDAGIRLAQAKLDAGDERAASELFHQLVDLCESQLPSRDPRLARALSGLAAAERALRSLDKSDALHRRALALKELQSGTNALAVVEDLIGLAENESRRQKYAEADSYFQRALGIQESSLDQHDPNVAFTRWRFADLLWKQGDFERANASAKQALQSFEHSRRSRHPDTAGVLNLLGNIATDTGQLDAALGYYQRSLNIYESFLSPSHPRVTALRGNLATVYHARGEFDKAREIARNVVEMLERDLGPDSPQVAFWALNLGIMEADAGNLGEAERIWRRALAIFEEANGPEHQSVAFVLSNLASVYFDEGLFQEAADLQARALHILERVLGPNHPRVSDSRLYLGQALRELGRLPAAGEEFERARAIREAAFGPTNHQVALVLVSLAELRLMQGDPRQASRLLEQAVEMTTKELGPESNNLAAAFLIWGKAERALGHSSRAQELFERAVRIVQHTSDPVHPLISSAQLELGDLLWQRGDLNHAVSFYDQAMVREDKRLGLLLGAVSDRRQEALFASLRSSMDEVISFQMSDGRDLPQAARLAFEGVLARKGRLLEAATDQWAQARRAATPEDRRLLQELQDIRGRIARLAYEKAPDSSEQQEQIASLETKRAKLEDDLVGRLPLPRFIPLAIGDVASKIPPDALFVEFVRYVKRKPGSDRKVTEERYAAYVLSSNGKLRWRDLGSAKAIDRSVARLREALVHPEDQRFRDRARALDRLVFQPIAAFFDHETHAIVSPDGNLSLVPFAVLIDEHGRYRLESFQFTYLDSARDLVRLTPIERSAAPALVIGAPDFKKADAHLPDVVEGAMKPSERREDAMNPELRRSSEQIRSHEFPPLHGAEDELREVSSRLGVVPILGAEATEERIKAARAPKVLHIATHAFFLEGSPASQEHKISPAAQDGLIQARIDNPLLRSALVLAGANEPSQQIEDGVLTALEVSALNLAGTELVVLSGCETGLGEVRNANGVYGLRRAFAVAGVRSQMISLWKVDDQATRLLMSRYYDRLLRGEGRSEALRQTQLALLNNPASQDPYFWAAFVLSGDWRPLSD